VCNRTQLIGQGAVVVKKLMRLSACVACLLLLGSCGLFEEAGLRKKHLAKLSYAIKMSFDCSLGDAYNGYKDEKYKTCLFVESRDDASGYSDDTIVCWPSHGTVMVLSKLNGEVEDKAIDLGLYSLKYPVTVHDTVYDWENVDSFLDSLDADTLPLILDPFKANR
jgi:hypothetical protein